MIEPNVYGESAAYTEAREAGFRVTVLLRKQRFWTTARAPQVELAR